MRYKNCTPEVQIFLMYEPLKWGTVPRNGAQMATLPQLYRSKGQQAIFARNIDPTYHLHTVYVQMTE